MDNLAIKVALSRIKVVGDSSIKAAKKLKPEEGPTGLELWQLVQLSHEFAAAVLALRQELASGS
jgi:hypothetical protein